MQYSNAVCAAQVMVWIHGGGLYMGGASQYDGSVLATYGNIVVVIIQYRLGFLGYFRYHADAVVNCMP